MSEHQTPYQKDRDSAAREHWEKYKDYQLEAGKSIEPEFRDFCYGADWGKEWNEEKGTGNLIEFMDRTVHARVKRLEDFCDQMASFIKNKFHVPGVNNPDFKKDRDELLEFWYGTLKMENKKK